MTSPDDQRWVLLEPPTAAARFWRRALALAVPALVAALMTYPPEVVGQRSTAQWIALGVAALATLAGAGWTWIAAGLPRENTAEVNRLMAWRPAREYRRLERALRRGEPLTGDDRPLAAAYVASQQTHRHQPSGILLGIGVMLTNLTDSNSGVWTWLVSSGAVIVILLLLAMSHRVRTLYEAADRAGVAPQVADTPPPSPRVPGSRPSFRR